MKHDDGFTMKDLTQNDEGIYQCFAENTIGTAVDQPIKLTSAWINEFPEKDPVIIDVEKGAPFYRHCTPPASVPKARVYWILMKLDSSSFHTLNSSMISSVDNGNIYFHAVTDANVYPEKVYACVAENTVLHDYKFGQHFRFNLKRTPTSDRQIPPQEQFVSPSSMEALKGESMTIHCFFFGTPVPTPKWYKDGKLIDVNKENVSFPNFGKSLEISNIKLEDNGTYECRYSSSPQLNRQIEVNVEAAPYKAPGTDWAGTATVTAGYGIDIGFHTSGIPSPTYTFYRNGQAIGFEIGDYAIFASRFGIPKAIKGVHDAVYQLKAENIHGYEWANFYIHVNVTDGLPF